MEKINDLKALIDGMSKDLEKFYVKGQNSAGTRIRKQLAELKRKAQEIRNEIQSIRNERKSQPSS